MRVPSVTWEQYVADWADLHGGTDLRRARPWVRRWLRLGFVIARSLRRFHVPAGAVTAVGLLLSVLVIVLATRGGHAIAIAGGLVVVAAFADTVDGALAVLTGRTTRLGYVYDAVVDRLAEACWLIALWQVGAAARVAVAACALTWLHEYIRSRSNAAGMTEIGAVTVGERPTRVAIAAGGLLVAGFASPINPHVAPGVAAFATATWIVLGLIGIVQLLGAVHRALAGKQWPAWRGRRGSRAGGSSGSANPTGPATGMAPAPRSAWSGTVAPVPLEGGDWLGGERYEHADEGGRPDLGVDVIWAGARGYSTHVTVDISAFSNESFSDERSPAPDRAGRHAADTEVEFSGDGVVVARSTAGGDAPDAGSADAEHIGAHAIEAKDDQADTYRPHIDGAETGGTDAGEVVVGRVDMTGVDLGEVDTGRVEVGRAEVGRVEMRGVDAGRGIDRAESTADEPEQVGPEASVSAMNEMRGDDRPNSVTSDLTLREPTLDDLLGDTGARVRHAVTHRIRGVNVYTSRHALGHEIWFDDAGEFAYAERRPDETAPDDVADEDAAPRADTNGSS